MVPYYPPPSNPRGRGGRGRGRGRRGRGRPQGGNRPGGQPSAGISNTRSGAKVTIRDTEMLKQVTKTPVIYVFNPGNTDMPRLYNMAQMYTRYRFKYLNVAYKSGSGTSVVGNVAVGIASGPALMKTADATTDKILKLRPSFFVPAWKNDTLSIGSDIDLSRFMLCSDTTADGIAFCLYVASTADNLGFIQVSYEIEFSQPRPFPLAPTL